MENRSRQGQITQAGGYLGMFSLVNDMSEVKRYRDLFARAVKLQSDTRLKAGETRREHFTFDVGSKALANVKMRLVYRHTPQPDGESPVKQVFLTQSWTLPPV